MRNTFQMRVRLYSGVCLALSFAMTLLCIMTGNFTDAGYDVTVGRVSNVKIVAPRQIENTFATERARAEAANSVTPLFKIDQAVTDGVIENIRALFDNLEERRKEALMNTLPPMGGTVQSQLAGDADSAEESSADANVPSILYPTLPGDAENPAPTEDSDTTESAEEAVAPIATTIHLNETQFEYYIKQPLMNRNELKSTCIQVAEEILANGIKDETDTKSLLFARESFEQKSWDEPLRNIGYYIVTSALEPNLVVDEEATTTAIEAKMEQVEPVIILEGQRIVDEGDVITEEAYSVLQSLDLIADNSDKNLFEIIGSIALILLIFFVFVTYVKTFHKDFLNSRKEITLMTILYNAAIIMVRLMSGLTFYIIPLTIPVILIAILVDQRLSIIVNMFLVLLSALIYKGNFEFLLFFMVGGSVVILFSGITFERTKIILVGLIVCVTNTLIVMGINLFYYKSLEPALMLNGAIAIANGLLSLLIAIGSLPIWEAMFDIVTPIKLLDLTSPNNDLLRKLTIEAPGTYHHSLIVANLAEQAAHDVGANAPLARVGGYYHDIGKLKYPYYFAENQAGENPHDQFDPYDSARLIREHVPLGLEMARQHNLPKAITDMIHQHHGTTMVKFFYFKAKKMYSDDYVKESDFRYDGVIPQSKEAAIVMLADTAEAAVRSMISSSKSMSDVEAFLKVLIKDKLDDGQLDGSKLTISDLEIIRKAFMKVFRGMYHERVKYPDGEKKDAAKAETAPEPDKAAALPAPETIAAALPPESAPKLEEGKRV